MAESELKRISGITKQTLHWSRAFQQLPTEIAGTLFIDVLQLFAGKIKNRQVEVFVGGGQDIHFFGIANQLRQVIANFLGNAIQSRPLGGKTWLSSEADGDSMEIIVRDEGTGMSEETLRNLFEPSYSTKVTLEVVLVSIFHVRSWRGTVAA